MRKKPSKSIIEQGVVEQATSVVCRKKNSGLKSQIITASILFLVLFAAALFCGCYSGSYGDPIDPCDPDVPVVLNGDTIPEEKIVRDSCGCVTRIDLCYMMGISDSNCISGIELYNTLERLYLNSNQLTNIDLSPLASCTNLQSLTLGSNDLMSIDLSPIWELDSLQYLYLGNNELDSASCAHVCDFIDEHPDCDVTTDCNCGGKSERNDELNMPDTETSMKNTDIHIRNTEAGERNTGINQTIADTRMKNTGVSVKYTEVDE